MKIDTPADRLVHAKTILLTLLTLLAAFLAACREAGETKPAPPLREARTFAGAAAGLGEPYGLAWSNGVLFVADGEAGAIRRIAAGGAVSLLTDRLHTPSQIAFDAAGDLIVADSGRHTIVRVKPDGAVETIAGVEDRPGFADGDAASALFRAPVGVAVRENRIYVADTYNDRIRVIENGRVTTLAGAAQGWADGAGAAAQFDTPCGLALNERGQLFVADSANGRLRVVETDGRVWTLAGRGAGEIIDGTLAEAGLYRPVAVAIDRRGAVFFTDGNAVRVIENRGVPYLRTLSSDRRGYADGALAAARFNRPSGLAADDGGDLFVADSENQAVRVLTGAETGQAMTLAEIESTRLTAERFRALAEPRWSYDPPDQAREIAGTLGEIRGEMKPDAGQVWFHNGLDITGAYGETARFVRAEKVLRTDAAENFETLRELLRMPTLGYIHIRLGRDQSGRVYDDPRFLFARAPDGKPTGVRVPRGARFAAGEPIGTLNAMNHVHLVAGRSGAEMNALDALALPGASDAIAPVIEAVELFDDAWRPLETNSANARISLNGRTRIVVRAYDRMDGNAARRRLGVYRLGYQILRGDKTPVTDELWSIRFDRLPEPEAVRLVYAAGSRSGATGETVFRYIVTNQVRGNVASEDFFDAAGLENGNYVLRVLAADYFGNTAAREVQFAVSR